MLPGPLALKRPGTPRALARNGAAIMGGALPTFSPARIFTGGVDGGWYDISDLSTVWADTAGTTPASVNGAVARVDDKSGNGRNLLQATGTKQPLLRQDGTTGKYYLETDGVDDFMASAATYTLAFSHYMAAMFAKTAEDGLVFFGAIKDTNNYHRFINIATNGRVQGSVRGLNATPAAVGPATGPASNLQAFPVNAVKIIDSLCNNTASTIDNNINNVSQGTAGSVTLGANVVASSAITLCATTPTTTAAHVIKFYRGMVVKSYEPDIATRAAICRFLAQGQISL